MLQMLATLRRHEGGGVGGGRLASIQGGDSGTESGESEDERTMSAGSRGRFAAATRGSGTGNSLASAATQETRGSLKSYLGQGQGRRGATSLAKKLQRRVKQAHLIASLKMDGSLESIAQSTRNLTLPSIALSDKRTQMESRQRRVDDATFIGSEPMRTDSVNLWGADDWSQQLDEWNQMDIEAQSLQEPDGDMTSLDLSQCRVGGTGTRGGQHTGARGENDNISGEPAHGDSQASNAILNQAAKAAAAEARLRAPRRRRRHKHNRRKVRLRRAEEKESKEKELLDKMLSKVKFGSSLAPFSPVHGTYVDPSDVKKLQNVFVSTMHEDHEKHVVDIPNRRGSIISGTRKGDNSESGPKLAINDEAQQETDESDDHSSGEDKDMREQEREVTRKRHSVLSVSSSPGHIRRQSSLLSQGARVSFRASDSPQTLPTLSPASAATSSHDRANDGTDAKERHIDSIMRQFSVSGHASPGNAADNELLQAIQMAQRVVAVTNVYHDDEAGNTASGAGRKKGEEDKKADESATDENVSASDERGKKTGGRQRPAKRTSETAADAALRDGDVDQIFPEEDYRRYFGTGARADFFEGFKSVAAQHGRIEAEDLSEPLCSPRQVFYREIVKNNLLPWPLLVRRLTHPKVIDLHGLGLGDDALCALAKVLPVLPVVESLNVRNNRLTDTSLLPLCEAIVNIPSLTSLNLSENKVDESSDTIRTYLRRDSCKLKQLVLINADVDDFECGDLMDALNANHSLLKLDLSGNLIGTAENLNVVHPELITGGEAIGETLTINTTLTQLNLSWNYIRLESAVAIGKALRYNRVLKELILTHNSFADLATQELGASLALNEGLTYLDISFNAVSPAACMVISNAFKTNNTLMTLILDGNILGQRGAETLMDAVRRGQREDRFLRVSMANCDTEKLVPGLFNPMEPTGEYTIDMCLPYSQMVASELYRLARVRAGAEFREVTYRAPESAVWEPVQLQMAARKRGGRSSWQTDLDRFVVKLKEVRKSAALRRGDSKVSVGSVRMSGSNKQGSPHRGSASGGGGGSGSPSPSRSSGGGLMTATAIRERRQEDAIATHNRLMDEMSKRLQNLMQKFGLNPELGIARRILLDMTMPRRTPPARSSSSGEDGDGGERDDDGSEDEDEDEDEWRNEDSSGDDVLDLVFRSVFRIIDADRSGAADCEELAHAIRLLGLDSSPSKVRRLMSEYDIDGSGEIEEDEFVMCMQREYLSEKQGANGELIDKSTGKAWVVPADGELSIAFYAERLPPNVDEVDSEFGLQGLIDNIQVAANEAEKTKLFEKATTNSDIYLTADQGQRLLEECGPTTGGDILATVTRLLPQMLNPDQAIRLVESNLNWEQKMRLRVRLGNAFNPIMGNLTGHYKLDLTEPTDRLAARKIAEINNIEKRYGQRVSGRGNTTQKGNWENFRNETYNNQPFVLSGAWFIKIPLTGTARFDYASTGRPQRNIRPMSKRRFTQLLTKLQLERLALCRERLEEMERLFESDDLSDEALREMQNQMAEELAETASVGSATGGPTGGEGAVLSRGGSIDGAGAGPGGDGPRSPSPQGSVTFDDQGSLGSDENARKGVRFAEHADDGSLIMDASMIKSSLKRSMSISSRMTGIRSVMPIRIPSYVTLVQINQHWLEWKHTSHKELNYFGVERKRDIGKVQGTLSAAADENGEKKSTNKKEEEEAPNPLYQFTYIKLLELQVSVCGVWLSCAQVREIINHFPVEDYGRVEALCALFGRIVDMENLHKLSKELTTDEEKEFWHRVGILNIMNPMDPDRTYDLDLRSWEQREYCKVLVRLAIDEPGENWLNESYRWAADDDPVPGWELPESWALPDSEAGPRTFGRLTLTYTSAAELGCAPVWDTRRELFRRVLCGSIRPT